MSRISCLRSTGRARTGARAAAGPSMLPYSVPCGHPCVIVRDIVRLRQSTVLLAGVNSAQTLVASGTPTQTPQRLCRRSNGCARGALLSPAPCICANVALSLSLSDILIIRSARITRRVLVSQVPGPTRAAGTAIAMRPRARGGMRRGKAAGWRGRLHVVLALQRAVSFAPDVHAP